MKQGIKSFCTVFLMLALIPLSALIFNQKENTDVFTVYDEASNKSIQLSEREYVIGALCSEMPPTFHTEALKAQAAAIYTNAFREKRAGSEYHAKINSQKQQGFLSKDKLKQNWGKSFDVYYKKMCDAVDSVLGCVLTYEGSPIVAAYHSQSPGKTESAQNVWGSAVKYLVAVESEGDTFSAELESKQSVSSEKARKILKEAFTDAILPLDDALLITDLEFSESGTVVSAFVGNIKTNGQKLRELFSLRSACFSVSCLDGELIFSVKGYGHGVGMSQYGADFMARQGKNWREIVKHYYTDIVIMRSV